MLATVRLRGKTYTREELRDHVVAVASRLLRRRLRCDTRLMTQVILAHGPMPMGQAQRQEPEK